MFTKGKFSTSNHIDLNYLYPLLLLDIVLPAGPFLRENILWYEQNFQWVQNSIFPDGKLIFPYSFSLINT